MSHRYQPPMGVLAPTLQPLFENNPAASFVPWQPVDDSTMGGRSRSEFVLTERRTACFQGFVSLDNGGGFCSVKSPEFVPASTTSAVRLRVRGDGKTYRVCLHTRHMPPGTSYRSSFTPARDEWVEVTIPLTEFMLMRFGTRAGVSPVDPARITALSLLISDRQEGPFALEVAHIRLVDSATDGMKC